MRKCRIGVVGCGVIGSYHIASCVRSPYAEAAAVADVREEAARALAERHGVSKVYTDPQELFADPDIDGVILALPAHLRTRLALQAFEHGKHVLIEKPVAMNAGEVRQMIAARAGRVAMCCQNRYEFLPSTRAAADFVASGALGKLRLIRVRGLGSPANPPPANPPIWRLRRDLNGGGIMSNWGCYDLHYMFSVINWQLAPRTVLAQMWPIGGPVAAYAAPGSDAETHLSMLVQCDDDLAINYERGELLAAATDRSWEIIGEAGSLRLHMTVAPDKQIVFYENRGQGTVSRIIWEGQEEPQLAHQGTVDHFAQAVNEGRASDEPLRQALLVQELTDAAYRSAQRGGASEVNTEGVRPLSGDRE